MVQQFDSIDSRLPEAEVITFAPLLPAARPSRPLPAPLLLAPPQRHGGMASELAAGEPESSTHRP